MNSETIASTGINTEMLLLHWQSHRRLTRRVIDAFPESTLFEYSIGGMRPFGEMVMELIMIADGIMEGMTKGVWQNIDDNSHTTDSLREKSKSHLLEVWDDVTAKIDRTWPSFSADDFNRVEKAFNAYENSNLKTIQYALDNEIHHRGQAYVYLRSLDIQPPFFWEH